MFSNGNTKPNSNFLSTNQQQWRLYEANDNHPYSPQTRPLSPNNFPISSFKSLSSSPNLQQLPTKLTPLIEQQNQQYSHVQSKIIKLISSNQSSLHFHDEAASVFQRYPSNQIAFVGIWGAEGSDKSFFYDRILNLCDIEGEKYVNASMVPGSNAQIFFYERPFVKNGMRIFLLECKGYKNPHQLTKTQKNQLDILLALCQVIILIEDSNLSPNEDITQIGYQHLNQSFRRLYIDKKKKQEQPSEICWPKSLFILYNTSSSIKKHQKSKQHEKELSKMFRDYNFSILHSKNSAPQQIKSYTTITNPLQELYLKNASIIFREIYDKIEGKSYMNMRYNGFTSPHILTQLTYAINQHHSLYLPKVFNKAKKAVFLSIYNRHALGYLLKMKQYISEEKPYSTDYLINAFQNASEEIMEEYEQMQNQVAVKPAEDSLCLEYEKKLQDYIEEKQKNILAVNNKKSSKQLANLLVLPSQVSNPQEQFRKIQYSILQTNRNFDSNAQSLAIANALKSIYAKNPNIMVGSNQNDGELVTYDGGQVIQYENSTNLQQKRQFLNQKKAQLEQLNSQIMMYQTMDRQIIKYQQEEQSIVNQIRRQQQKIRLAKTNINSQLSGNSNDALLQQAIKQVQQLKYTLNSKINEKNTMQQMVKSSISPQAQILQSKLISKKQQIEKLMRETAPNRIQVVRAGGPMAERRVIDAKSANIRRVHGSQI